VPLKHIILSFSDFKLCLVGDTCLIKGCPSFLFDEVEGSDVLRPRSVREPGDADAVRYENERAG
jgi:hypothetical protein